MRIFLTLFFTLFISSVWAAPVTWTLNDVTFESGAVATGQFTWDADTLYFYDIDIAVSDRPSSFGIFERDLGSGQGHLLQVPTVAYFDYYNVPVWDTLVLEFASVLTNAGGVVSLSPTSREYSAYGVFFADPIWTDYVVSGTVSAVPIPAAVWLFASGLGLLGSMHRRRNLSH